MSPVESRPLVMAILQDDTVSTYADTLSGDFMFRGLSEGSYSLEFFPIEDFQSTLISDVSVIPGEITVLDTLFIQ